MKLISIIIPVYNEEKNIERAYEAVTNEFKNNLYNFDYEIIFTDNHSTDDTFKKLKAISANDPKVRVLRFVRNIGFQHSILTGYRVAKGDAAIQIDCDLQDPPSVFSDFIRFWETGHDVVVGIRLKRAEPFYMKYLRRFYYWFLNKISDVSDVPHEANAGDFRLVDRSILQHLHHINETHPYVRGLISELSKNQTGVYYVRNKREFGESKFSLKHLLKMGLQGIFSYSTKPLRLASYLGILISLITAIMISLYIICRTYFGQQWPAGFTTTTVLILFGISLNAIFLGIIGEYIGRIYNQLRHRPIIIIEKAINMDFDVNENGLTQETTFNPHINVQKFQNFVHS